MSTVIPIPGGTATLRDKLVSERQHRLLEAAFMAASSAMSKVQAAGVTEDISAAAQSELMAKVHLSFEEANAMLELQSAAIVAFLENWSLKRPLPTMSDVEDIDRDLYQAIAQATIGRATAVATAAPTDFTTAGKGLDQDRPTGASGSYDGLSEAVPEPPSTPPPSGSTTSTASDS